MVTSEPTSLHEKFCFLGGEGGILGILRTKVPKCSMRISSSGVAVGGGVLLVMGHNSIPIRVLADYWKFPLLTFSRELLKSEKKSVSDVLETVSMLKGALLSIEDSKCKLPTFQMGQKILR